MWMCKVDQDRWRLETFDFCDCSNFAHQKTHHHVVVGREPTGSAGLRNLDAAREVGRHADGEDSAAGAEHCIRGHGRARNQRSWATGKGIRQPVGPSRGGRHQETFDVRGRYPSRRSCCSIDTPALSATARRTGEAR